MAKKKAEQELQNKKIEELAKQKLLEEKAKLEADKKRIEDLLKKKN